LSRGGTFLFLALFIVSAVSCKEDLSRTTPQKQKLTELGSIEWIEDGGDFEAMTREEFAAAAVAVLVDLPTLPASAQAGKIMLKGSLYIADGQGTLVLESRTRLDGMKDPMQTGVAATGSAGSAAEATSLINNGLGDLKKALRDLRLLVNAGPDKWISSLDSVEPDEQILVAQLLGRDKVKKAVLALGRLLLDPREQVQDAASDALAQIGDKRAVPLLISAIKRGNLRSEVRAIEAMGKIGGEEAKAYLEMTAVGHEMEEVRTLSKSLLDDLNKR
jgi:hypothetical protein